VFVPVSDPVASGFVASFARPDGNITGFTDEEYSFGTKWLSILKNISPDLRHVMVLYDPGNANWEGYLRTLQAAERSMMVSVSPAPVNSSGDIALYVFRDHPEAGSLISYGPSRTEAWRQSSLYVARVLKGEKPADLPVQQASRFEMALNLKTAKAIGLDVPTEILALADEVIE
jgi:putative tryptophan/tyrosine transport system substrate-binding protein